MGVGYETTQETRTAEELSLHLGLKRLGENEIASSRKEELPRTVLLTERELVVVVVFIWSIVALQCYYSF